MRAALTPCTLDLADLVIAGTSRLNLRSRGGQRGMARTIHDPQRTRLATVGRLDSAVLSFRGARRCKESLVLVWMFIGVGRNAQGTALVRGAVFSYLATVAEEMDECAARSCRVHSNFCAYCFTLASANARGLDCIRCICRHQPCARFAVPLAASRYIAGGNFRSRRVCNRSIRRRQFCLV